MKHCFRHFNSLRQFFEVGSVWLGFEGSADIVLCYSRQAGHPFRCWVPTGDRPDITQLWERRYSQKKEKLAVHKSKCWVFPMISHVFGCPLLASKRQVLRIWYTYCGSGNWFICSLFVWKNESNLALCSWNTFLVWR